MEEKRLTGFPACSDVVVFCAVMSTFYFPRSDKHDGKAGFSLCRISRRDHANNVPPPHMLPVNRIAWLGVFCVSVKIKS